MGVNSVLWTINAALSCLIKIINMTTEERNVESIIIVVLFAPNTIPYHIMTMMNVMVEINNIGRIHRTPHISLKDIYKQQNYPECSVLMPIWYIKWSVLEKVRWHAFRDYRYLTRHFEDNLRVGAQSRSFNHRETWVSSVPLLPWIHFTSAHHAV